jgi:uncharacterized protein YegJ (DUF2314 family)
MNQRLWPALLICAFLGGCTPKSEPNTSNEPPAQVVAPGNPEKEQVSEAKASLDTFVARLKAPQEQEGFAVRADMPTSKGGLGHIWVKDVVLSGQDFKGTIAETDPALPNLKEGATITVKRNEVSDWVILGGSRYEGGFTISGAEDLPVVKMDADDPEMNAAIERAKASLDTFAARLKTAKPGEQFMVKAAMPASDGSTEHIWVDHLKLVDGGFVGKLANEPYGLPGKHKGSAVNVGRSIVSDWTITKNGKYEGGFTIDVLAKREGQDPLPR